METQAPVTQQQEPTFEEKDVGISEYLGKGTSLLARYKYRYSDFIVNEIAINGQVIKPPPRRDPNAKREQVEEKKATEEPTSIVLTKEQEDIFRGMLSDNDFKNLLRFFEELNFSNYKKGTNIEMDSPEDKDVRRKFHETVRGLGSSKLDSDTFDVNGRKMVRILVLDEKSKRRRYDKKEYPDKYLQFTLHKTNYDTMGAIGILSKFLQTKPNGFGLAGNKDKRGVTTQRVTLFHALAEDLEKLQDRKKWIEQISMGEYSYVPKQLKIGDLKGNRFALGLRLVQNVDEETIANNIKPLVEKGFINYYGLQRFGVTNIRTHTVGKEVLKKDWKNVVEFILSASDSDPRADEAKKEFLKTRDCKTALRKLPSKCKIEKSLIEGLKHQGQNNYKGAFMCLPRFMREIYGHAYQSYIWNKTASIRIAKYGIEPIAGDMVFLGNEDAVIEDEVLDNEAVPLEPEGEGEVKKEAEGQVEVEEEKKEDANARPKFDPTQVIILTEETKGNYKLEDIIIPLVGREVPLPENNPISEIIHQVLKEDEISLEDFNNSDQDVFFRGGYRKMVVKPEDIQWDIVKYNDDDQEILNPHYFTEKEFESVPDGKYQAIRIKFNLPKSSYATMCVRELTKNSTSLEFQRKLNDMK